MLKKMNLGPKALVVMLAAVMLLLSGVLALAADKHKQWWPVKVNAYYGKYDVKMKKAGRPSGSLQGPKV